MIKFDKVSIKRGKKIVLSNICFEILENQNIAIVGDNGSGKSTLLDAILGRIFPFQGKIIKPHYSEIESVPRDYSFNRVIGAAFQYYQQRYQAYDSEIGPTLLEVFQNQVKPVGTVDNKSVDLPPLSYDSSWIKEISRQMNVLHLLDRKVTSLSNGETRRSLIAISLLKKPRILLLDNPFTGLDKESKESLNKLLSGVETQLILVSPLNNLPEKIERLLVLNEGELVLDTQKPFPTIKENKKRIEFDESLINSIDSGNEMSFKSALLFKNINVDFGEKKVLSGINWQVKNGEKWALLGPNGSGKSTLLSLITGDNPKAYQNDIQLFDKKRGSGESIWDIKKKIGFVSPEMHLFFPKRTEVWKVIASGFYDTLGLYRKINGKEELEVDKMLDFLQLKKLKNSLLAELSTGEQRLALLGRALIKNPPLLILDEPCQNLDFNHMVIFRDLIDEIMSRMNKTLIYVSHNEEEIPKCVNKIFRLENGARV